MVVQLRSDGIGGDPLSADSIAGAAAVVVRHVEEGVTHLVLAMGGRRYRLAIFGSWPSAEPLSYAIPIDGFWETRRAAMSAFHEHIHQRHLRRRPASLVPGRSERWRLVQWLRLLDALPDGVSARDLAVDLIARAASGYSSAEWDVSSERKRIGRWQRNALAIRDGGYRRLLQGH